MQQAAADTDYEPLGYFLRCWDEERAGAVATVVGGDILPGELGQHYFSDVVDVRPLATNIRALRISKPSLRQIDLEGRTLELFAAPVDLPLALLLCGAGPDAIPIAQLALSLGWRVTVYDHRKTYADPHNFPEFTRIILGRPEELTDRLDLSRFDAAVIMSHHLQSDIGYLKRLARLPPGYVGALGPVARRQRLLTKPGPQPPSSRICMRPWASTSAPTLLKASRSPSSRRFIHSNFVRLRRIRRSARSRVHVLIFHCLRGSPL